MNQILNVQFLKILEEKRIRNVFNKTKKTFQTNGMSLNTRIGKVGISELLNY